jgi:hypothetical protein
MRVFLRLIGVAVLSRSRQHSYAAVAERLVHDLQELLDRIDTIERKGTAGGTGLQILFILLILSK